MKIAFLIWTAVCPDYKLRGMSSRFVLIYSDLSPVSRDVRSLYAVRSHDDWMLNVSAKCLHFRFEFAEGQNAKIHANYKNSFQAQNAKISAVSTPILTAKAAFFSVFRALSEKSVENG